jgi:hypothetical protein
VIPAELRDMLLTSLQPGFEINQGEFTWNADSSLTMTFKISVLRARQKPRSWEIRFSVPAGETRALWPEATFPERQWFATMVRNHIADWLDGRPSIIESAHLVK